MKGNILILEDDVQLAIQWRMALVSKGYVVSLAHRASEALTVFEENEFDLCIVDFMVYIENKPSPDGGLTFIGKLSAASRKNTIILGVSGLTLGFPSIDAENHLLNLGADSFLGKPFSNDQLIEEVERLLS